MLSLKSQPPPSNSPHSCLKCLCCVLSLGCIVACTDFLPASFSPPPHTRADFSSQACSTASRVSGVVLTNEIIYASPQGPLTVYLTASCLCPSFIGRRNKVEGRDRSGELVSLVKQHHFNTWFSFLTVFGYCFFIVPLSWKMNL